MSILLLLLTIAIIVGVSIGFTLLIFSFTIWGDVKGAPFVRSRKDRMETMLELADIKPGTRMLELGSGDATLLIEAARKGAYAQGIEINPFLVWFSKRKIQGLGLADRAMVTRANIFDISLTDKNADVVFLYLLPDTLEKLKEKLCAELAPETRIISNAFRIEGLEPIKQENNVYVYEL